MTVDPDKLAELQVRATIKQDKVIYDADTAPKSAKRGIPLGSDAEAAHELLAALFRGFAQRPADAEVTERK